MGVVPSLLRRRVNEASRGASAGARKRPRRSAAAGSGADFAFLHRCVRFASGVRDPQPASGRVSTISLPEGPERPRARGVEMMKSRDTLIRLKRFKVGEKRRRVAQIELMIAEFDRMSADLDREIAAEEQKAGNS